MCREKITEGEALGKKKRGVTGRLLDRERRKGKVLEKKEDVMGYFAARQAQTTLPCPDCGQPLLVERSCREAHMLCPGCRRRYDLKPFIAKADEALERFLEGLYFDRI